MGRGQPKQPRGRGLATQPSGRNGPWQRVRVARSQRGHRARSARAVARSTAARWGLAGGKVLPVSTSGLPGRRRARRVETGLTEAVGQRKTAGAAVFNDGRVAPVVVNVWGGVLQHRCRWGKMGLAPI
jgi:hypothetical protein